MMGKGGEGREREMRGREMGGVGKEGQEEHFGK